jgi:hypothetical protein
MTWPQVKVGVQSVNFVLQNSRPLLLPRWGVRHVLSREDSDLDPCRLATASYNRCVGHPQSSRPHCSLCLVASALGASRYIYELINIRKQ